MRDALMQDMRPIGSSLAMSSIEDVVGSLRLGVWGVKRPQLILDVGEEVFLYYSALGMSLGRLRESYGRRGADLRGEISGI